MTQEAGASGLERLTVDLHKALRALSVPERKRDDTVFLRASTFIGREFVEAALETIASLSLARPAGAVLPVSDAMREAKQHAVELEQCSLFVDSPPLVKAMTDAAAFLRALSVQEPAPSPAVVVDEAMVERAAKALYREAGYTSWAKLGEMYKAAWRKQGRAVLEAALSVQEPAPSPDIEAWAGKNPTTATPAPISSAVVVDEAMVERLKRLETWLADFGGIDTDAFARTVSDALAALQNAGGEQPAPKVERANGPTVLNYEASLHLNWIADRLEHVYGENPNYDYMQRLREIADEITPPATPAPNGVSGAVREALEKAAQEAAAKGSDLRNDDATRRGGAYAAYLIRNALASLSQEPSPSARGEG